MVDVTSHKKKDRLLDAFELVYLRVAFLVRFYTLCLPLTCHTLGNWVPSWLHKLMIQPLLPTPRVELKRLKRMDESMEYFDKRK